MATRLEHTKKFNADLRKLARKYPSVLEAVDALSVRLKRDERPGKLYKRVGGRVFRERLPNRSARRGKSGGFRVAYRVDSENNIMLLAICARKDCPDLGESAIRRLLRELDL